MTRSQCNCGANAAMEWNGFPDCTIPDGEYFGMTINEVWDSMECEALGSVACPFEFTESKLSLSYIVIK